jgi:hypothetical protein
MPPGPSPYRGRGGRVASLRPRSISLWRTAIYTSASVARIQPSA